MKNSTIIIMAILFWMGFNANRATAQVNADSIVIRSVAFLSPTARAVAVDVYGLLAPGLPANFTVDKGICPSYNNLGVTINNAITVTGNSSYTITVNGLPADSCIMLRAKIGGGNASAFSKYFSFANSGCISALNLGANATVCSGSGTVLNASGGVSYNWSPSTGLDHSNIANPTATPASSTNYVVHVVDASGCTGTGTVSVTVLTATATITASGATFCKGANGTLNANGGTGSYLWSPSTGLSNPNISNPVASPSVTTTYTVTGGNSGGCPVKATAIASVNVNNNNPVITMSANTVCKGSVPTSITLTGNGVFSGVGVSNGYFDLTNPNIAIGPNIVTLTNTDANNCIAVVQNVIQVYNPPVVNSYTFFPYPTSTTGEGLLKLTGIFPYQIQMDINSGTPVTTSNQSSNSASFGNVVLNTNDIIEVGATSVGGCYTTIIAALLSVDETVLKNEDVKAGPNPFTSILNVSLPQGEYKISLVNMVGQIVYTTSAKGNFDIARGDLKQGIYFIQILSGKSTVTKKVVAE